MQNALKYTNTSKVLDQWLYRAKIHSYYAAIALRYRIAPYCTENGMLLHYGVAMNMTNVRKKLNGSNCFISLSAIFIAVAFTSCFCQ